MNFDNQKHGVWLMWGMAITAFLLIWLVGATQGMGQMFEGGGLYISGRGATIIDTVDVINVDTCQPYYPDTPKYIIIDTIIYEVEVCDTVMEWEAHSGFCLTNDSCYTDSFLTKIYRIKCQTKTVIDSVIVKMSMEQWKKIKLINKGVVK